MDGSAQGRSCLGCNNYLGFCKCNKATQTINHPDPFVLAKMRANNESAMCAETDTSLNIPHDPGRDAHQAIENLRKENASLHHRVAQLQKELYSAHEHIHRVQREAHIAEDFAVQIGKRIAHT